LEKDLAEKNKASLDHEKTMQERWNSRRVELAEELKKIIDEKKASKKAETPTTYENLKPVFDR